MPVAIAFDRRDVLTEVARRHLVPLRIDLVQQFGRDEMHLTQVRLEWISLDARSVFHAGTHVGVSVDSEAGDQRDGRRGVLREVVTR